MVQYFGAFNEASDVYIELLALSEKDCLFLSVTIKLKGDIILSESSFALLWYHDVDLKLKASYDMMTAIDDLNES